MSKRRNQCSQKASLENKPSRGEKLPYVKPELHRLHMGKTDGKSTVVTSEMVFTFSIGSTKPIGPS